MNRRLELHEKLKELIENDNVYFQPPASVHLTYPCVIYSIGNGDAKYANDRVYSYINSYDIIFIYKKPMIEIIDKVLETFPLCKMSRAYVVDNLNHYVFNLYF